jgi:hypothetical protein
MKKKILDKCPLQEAEAAETQNSKENNKNCFFVVASAKPQKAVFVYKSLKNTSSSLQKFLISYGKPVSPVYSQTITLGVY